jgi:hypothetical protein
MFSRVSVALLGAALLVPPEVMAHGVQGRAETPIPISAFFWVAAAVLIVSFLALGLGWSKPKLTEYHWRPAPERLQRFVLSPVTVWAARTFVLALFLLMVGAALFGSTRLNSNIAPVSIFVVWWVGLVPLSVLFGNVWRELNPWATIACLLRFPEEGERPLPPGVGLWPAVVLLVGWAWVELVYPTAGDTRLIATITLSYSAVTIAAMRMYGIQSWLDRAEAFSVYTGTLARLSAVEVREDSGRRRLGFRRPLVGVTKIAWQPGQIAFIGALIGTVTFDGLSGSKFWETRDVAAATRLIDRGMDPFWAGIVVATIGLLLSLVLVIAAYEAAAWASGKLAGWQRLKLGSRDAIVFVHSLIPIALAYFVAHYFTLFVFQSQDLIRLLSDPFGEGWDLFGTADHRIDFQLVSANAIWAVQLTAIIGGHVLGLMLAHDRALELADNPRAALRSQYPMLALMVLLTVAGLWSLSEGMATV